MREVSFFQRSSTASAGISVAARSLSARACSTSPARNAAAAQLSRPMAKRKGSAPCASRPATTWRCSHAAVSCLRRSPCRRCLAETVFCNWSRTSSSSAAAASKCRGRLRRADRGAKARRPCCRGRLTEHRVGVAAFSRGNRQLVVVDRLFCVQRRPEAACRHEGRHRRAVELIGRKRDQHEVDLFAHLLELPFAEPIQELLSGFATSRQSLTSCCRTLSALEPPSFKALKNCAISSSVAAWSTIPRSKPLEATRSG